MLSWAGSTVWRRELGVCVVDGVRDVGVGDAVGAELSVQVGDLVSQLTVFVVEFANAFCLMLPGGEQLGESRLFAREHLFGPTGQAAQRIVKFALDLRDGLLQLVERGNARRFCFWRLLAFA